MLNLETGLLYVFCKRIFQNKVVLFISCYGYDTQSAVLLCPV